ncbi:MAG: STAS domain-containing protein [Acidimicrobiia bacterium]|nr:STAS domain-containing protein [Acidimicrobiia bacterium]
MDSKPGAARFDPAPDGSPVLEVHGEIDVAAAGEFSDALTALIDTGAPLIVVDLAGVGFIDSSGLGALVVASQHAETTGAALTVRNAEGAVRRVFEVTGLLDTFGIDSPQS